MAMTITPHGDSSAASSVGSWRRLRVQPMYAGTAGAWERRTLASNRRIFTRDYRVHRVLAEHVCSRQRRRRTETAACLRIGSKIYTSCAADTDHRHHHHSRHGTTRPMMTTGPTDAHVRRRLRRRPS